MSQLDMVQVQTISNNFHFIEGTVKETFLLNQIILPKYQIVLNTIIGADYQALLDKVSIQLKGVSKIFQLQMTIKIKVE